MRISVAGSYALQLFLLLGSSQAQRNATGFAISKDGHCGSASNQTCFSSEFGNCCSPNGFCGSIAEYCGAQCQTDWGDCSVNSGSISFDGHCGAKDPKSQICPGSIFGSCCSENGFCGSTSEYCDIGCQPDFGTCGDTIAPNTTASRSANPAASSTSTGSTGSSTANSALTTSAVPASSSITSSTGFKAGMGVLGAVLGLAAIGFAAFLWRRNRHKKQSNSVDSSTGETDEALKTPTWAAPSSPRGQVEYVPSKPLTIPELSAGGMDEVNLEKSVIDRAELPGKDGAIRASEMPGDLFDASRK